MFVGPAAGHAAHHCQRIFRRCATMLTGARLAYPQFRVLTATPMDREDDLARLVVYINDDIGDQCPQKSLTRTHRNSTSVPGRRQIVRQVRESIGSDLYIRGLFGELARLELVDAPKCLLPALLQLRSDEAVVGIACRVAPFCESGFVASLLEFQIQDPVLVLLLFTVHPLCLERCFDRHRLHNPQNLSRDGGVHAWPAKSHATWQPHHKVRPVAAIHRPALRIAGIGDAEAPSASATGHHPRQQRPATSA